MNFDIREQLLYLLQFTENDIDNSIGMVLNDSDREPEVSAVTVLNMIACYLKVSEAVVGTSLYSGITDYLENVCLENAEVLHFMSKARKEAMYYHGKIFDSVKQLLDSDKGKGRLAET